MTLVDFLRSRLDEDEQVARDVAWTERTTSWRVTTRGVANGLGLVAERVIHIAGQRDDWMKHMARHDPARVLREVEAKRRMLDDLYPSVKSSDETIECEWGSDPCDSDTLLELLALPYADHPDYRPEWAP